MKKVITYTLGLIIGVSLLTSCKKDNPTPKTPEPIPTNAGTTLKLTCEATISGTGGHMTAPSIWYTDITGTPREENMDKPSNNIAVVDSVDWNQSIWIVAGHGDNYSNGWNGINADWNLYKDGDIIDIQNNITNYQYAK